jgi:hypothetical protein
LFLCYFLSVRVSFFFSFRNFWAASYNLALMKPVTTLL